MPVPRSDVFDALRSVLAKFAGRLSVQSDTLNDYTLVSRTPSPFPQHKGKPMFFGSVRSGKAYVSYHLMPLYMSPDLNKALSPALKKRMQGKTCFNFKSPPEPELLSELERITETGLQGWTKRNWL